MMSCLKLIWSLKFVFQLPFQRLGFDSRLEVTYTFYDCSKYTLIILSQIADQFSGILGSILHLLKSHKLAWNIFDIIKIKFHIIKNF